MPDVWATQFLGTVYEDLSGRLMAQRQSIPKNSPPTHHGGDRLFRRLDCAVINWAAKAGHSGGRDLAFDTVRGVFEEGLPASPGAAVRQKSHVQIAIRSPACILGIFRPTGYSL